MDGKQQNFMWTGLTLTVLLVAGWYFWGGFDNNTSNQQGASLKNRLTHEPDSRRIGLLRTLNPDVKAVQGELVWVPSKQEGMLFIQQLPKPKSPEFYQMWIYDTRGEKGIPISLGVLSEAQWREDNYLPLKGKVAVTEPYKFVLTLEQQLDTIPEQILLMAQP